MTFEQPSNLTDRTISRRVVVHTPEPGAGSGQYVSELVRALAAEGERVALFCPSNFSYSAEVTAAGVEILRAPEREVESASLLRRVLRNIVFTFGALQRFWTIVVRGDIVHFQFALHLGLGLLFFFVARLKASFVVLTVHDPLPHHWILPKPLRWVETVLLSIGYSLCDHLIVHNDAGLKILAERFGVDSKSVSVIPHGPLAPPPVERDIERTVAPAMPLRLLVFGSLRENKGIHLSIAAVQQVRRLPLDRSVTLTIAGCVSGFDAAYWDSCQRLIEQSPNGIEVIERVIEDEEVDPLFATHDALLLPYVRFFSESGVAMLALSQRRPIIATSAGGLGELLRTTDCGILIEAPTVEAVAASIREAASRPPEWLRQKGINGHRYASTSRSWKSIARRTQTLYDGLPNPSHSSDPEPRVVLHTPESVGSSALYIEALSKALAADGVLLRVVCPANHQAIEVMRREPSIDVRASRRRGTLTNVSFLSKVGGNLSFILSSALTLLRSTRPGDIVHFQYVLRLPFGLLFFACARAKRARIVLTVHDPTPHKFLFPGPLCHVETTGIACAYRWSDSLIVHSEAGKRKVTSVFRIPERKIRVIVHGPYELGRKVKPCPESRRLEVLFFGSFRENKAPHLAIAAVQRLAGEGVTIRLTLAGHVVNRNEESYWAGCRSKIDPACDSIRLIEKFIPDEDLPELFSNCHCVVLPYTTFSSDSGVAYMALANAKPIVSTGAGGLEWLLENSKGGIAISEANVGGVASALRVAVELGPVHLERMGRTGADWVLSNCGWPQVARETRKLYAEWVPKLGTVASSQQLEDAVVPMEAAR